MEPNWKTVAKEIEQQILATKRESHRHGSCASGRNHVEQFVTDSLTQLQVNFRFLEKKHDNAWFVISMLLEDGNQHLNKEINLYYSRGFHAAIYNVILTAAISVERIDAPELAGRKAENSAAIAASEGFKWKKITNQDDCANKQVIAIRTRKISPARCLQKSANLYKINGHDSAPVYLSVVNNLKKEGEYITLEREWANATGKRWNCVNNQLRNENNKWMTAWIERSWYLYQYDCHPDWADKIWIRHGLQIVNGFHFCLTEDLYGVPNGHTFYQYIQCNFDFFFQLLNQYPIK